MAYILNAACLCNSGKVRNNNEDNFCFGGHYLAAENNGLELPLTLSRSLRQTFSAAVFDGVGGASYGEYASYAAARKMQQSTCSYLELFLSNKRYLNKLVQSLNDSVLEEKQELRAENMGSTMVSFHFFRSNVLICNIGDSRAYLLRNGKLLQLSVDHVEKFAGSGKKKAPLTQCLGIDPEYMILEPYIIKKKLEQGDVYLLCSDGLTDMLSDEEISEILCSCMNPENSVEHLVRTALEHGGKDNITAIVCKVD